MWSYDVDLSASAPVCGLPRFEGAPVFGSGLYYLEEILKKMMMSAMHRDRDTGAVTERKLLSDMSAAIFQQEWCPTYVQKNTGMARRELSKLLAQRYLACQLP